MKKFFALALCLALALAAFAGCGAAAPASGELNLYTWEGMFPQDVLDAFTAETGIKVNYSSFDTDETMLAKLETAKGGEGRSFLGHFCSSVQRTKTGRTLGMRPTAKPHSGRGGATAARHAAARKGRAV